MSYNRRSGGSYGGGAGGNFGNSYSQGGNNYSGSGSYGGSGGGNYSGGGGGRFNNFSNYGRNPKMSPWESGVSPGGGMMPNVHPNQMALASDLLSKLLAPNQGGYGGSQNWGPNPGMMRRQESFKNQNRRRPDNRNRRPPPKKDDKKKDSKPEADKNDQSNEANGGIKKETNQEHIDYDGIPTAVLFCHVCQKHMWDGASFEKHVRGRPHELMMTYLDEGYKMQVELMRHQIKAAENQREIDLERMQAQNKGKAKPLFRNYCPMCNINFYGPLTGHRKSDRHRKLKQFLHPECKMCDMLFHTRLEWDDHKLSSDHLRKVGEQRRQFNPDLKDDEFELLDVVIIEDDEPEEIPVASKPDMLDDQEIKDDEKDLNEVSDGDGIKLENTGATVEGGDNVLVDDVEMKEGDTETKANETEGIEEKGEKDNNNANEDQAVIKKEKEEKYNPANVVGRELVVKTGGFVCRICSIFMKNNEEAVLHCQTASHYINFTTITKLHAKINNRKRKMKENENTDAKIVESDGEQIAKRARTDDTAEDVTNENGTAEPATIATDDDVQEIIVDVPIIEIKDNNDGQIKVDPPAVAVPETLKEPSAPAPVIKNSPIQRGRGSGRGRGVSRRGRSSR
ncbi:Zinc finger C2H2-type,Matrin/U1-C-like, C2H2-type zinc finger [Cinara cedri]|uniref:Zinc finger C2H2-type,Matrin/U1-C-like, C2H2-type zinc finger n=1 Tax=Cinara cedri TaxID=506608 RepID=A0A5E4MDE8_9HEMI|nr:Zinc finger C2H2-type,Matrin/U1-C-like, C2H2-type zinc finger [Cinara cedri]